MKEQKTRYEVFVVPFRSWINEKFQGSQKLAAERLNLSPSLISQVLSGRNPSKDFRNKCIDGGLPAEVFDKLDALDSLSKDIDVLTYEEIKFLYLEAKYIIANKNNVIKILEDRIIEIKRNSGVK